MRLAVSCLQRFAALTEALGVGELDVLATAAVRDAANGRDFVAEIERRTGLRPTILSGGEEARLSALGVAAGIPAAHGLMGDLGGGSLEIVALDRGKLGAHVTLPLGPLRLATTAGDDAAAVERLVFGALAGVEWLRSAAAETFYLVGGAWRALAFVHMFVNDYPLHIVHGYAVSAGGMRRMLAKVVKRGRRFLEQVPGLSGRRIDTLMPAAMVMDGVIEHAQPKRLVFSAHGLREGRLFDRLPPAQQARDPLHAACTAIAGDSVRFPLAAETLVNWSAPLFPANDPVEQRLRLAVSLVADIGWREHPDYRAEQVFNRLLRLPAVGLDHRERAYLALAAFARYSSRHDHPCLGIARELLPEGDVRRRALVLGSALRFAYTLSGGEPTMLSRCRLALADGVLTLRLARDLSALYGETVQRRFETLAAVGQWRTAVLYESAAGLAAAG
jgi:exopolyphosphatase/guanosine-5'-triphosphate,3'-diphosphate pyrophosphatase